MKPFRKRPKVVQAAPAPASTEITTTEQLTARVRELRAEHMELSRQILFLERNGVTVPDVDPEPRDAAALLLQGDDLEALTPVCTEPQAKLRALLLRRSIVKAALDLADDKSRLIAATEAEQRIKARKAEWRAAVRKVALTLLVLDRDLQDLDALHREIKPMAPLPFFAWPFPRMNVRGGLHHRFLQLAANEKIISEIEWTAALRQAGTITEPKR